MDLMPYFWPIFADFQDEAASLCISKSFDKDLKWTLIILQFHLKSNLFNPSQIVSIEAMRI